MSRFKVGDRVRAIGEADGLQPGAQYTVAGVEETFLIMSHHVTYQLRSEEGGSVAITNGHRLLEPAAP